MKNGVTILHHDIGFGNVKNIWKMKEFWCRGIYR